MEPTPDEQTKNLRVAYQEVCRSYHGIDDFRAKLLGLLPLASGAGIFLLLYQTVPSSIQAELVPLILFGIGLLGFVITLGLFVYELRGIEHCHCLIRAGQDLEEQLGIKGQFLLRPPEDVSGLGKAQAARVIYSVVLAAWIFVALDRLTAFFQPPILGALAALVTFSFFFAVSVRHQGKLNDRVELKRREFEAIT